MKVILKIFFLVAMFMVIYMPGLKAQDIFADGGTGSAQYTGITYPPTTEDYAKAFDNNASTKYLLFNFSGSIWLQWAANTPVAAVEYSITSGNDAPERDPKDWVLQGSQDGTSWTSLDTKTGEAFASRGLTKTYSISNATAYKHYRLLITAIYDPALTTLFQMADWALKATGAADIFPMGGTASAQYTAATPYSNPGETWDKVFDGDIGTKYLLQRLGAKTPAWVQWTANTPAIAAEYTITSANDAQTRDPKGWKLLGSQDGTSWTTLDTRTVETFATRGLVRTFSISNTTAYKHYRLQIDSTSGSTNLQFADWRLLKGLPPNAPSAIVLTNMSPTQVYVRFTDNSSNETSFQLERSTDGVNFSSVVQLNTNVSTYVNTGLTFNTKYYYRVRAANAYGTSAYSAIANITTMNYGSDTRDITDEPGTYSVQYANASPSAESPDKLIDNDFNTKYLIFSAANDPDGPATPDYWAQFQANAARILTYYTITSANDAPDRDPKNWELLGSNDGTNWTVVDTRAGELFSARFQTRIFILSAPAPSFTYFRWHVTANNGSTGIAGQIGEWQLFGLDPSVPVPPSNLKITAVTRTSISLSWSDNSSNPNETGFEIARSEDGIDFLTIATTTPNVTSYTDQNLLSDYRYYYQVRAKGSSANSFWSLKADTTTQIDPNLPRRPLNLRTTSVTNTDVALAWDDMANNETGFEIERSQDSTNYTRVGNVAADVTAFTNTGLTLATKYFYRVRAVNANGASVYSNVRTVITTGQNQRPAFNAIANQTTCNIHDTLSVSITGITPGPETWQQVNLSLSTNNSNLFSVLALTPVSSGAAQLKYKAKPGSSGSATITITAKDNGGVYNGGADTYQQTLTITINPLNVQVSADKANPVPRFQEVRLTASGATNYTWDSAHGIISGQGTSVLVVKPTINTTYKVTGSSAGGCRNEAQVILQLAGTYNPEVVNILTPNGDGKNDRWVIWNIATFPDNQVKVFDRAGRLVFYKKNYTNDWDGNYKGAPLPEGTYIYVINLGTGIPEQKGILTIIRDHK